MKKDKIIGVRPGSNGQPLFKSEHDAAKALSKTFPITGMTEIPVNFEFDLQQSTIIKAWRNRNFLAQLYSELFKPLRLSINKVNFTLKTGQWHDGITWDEIMQIKEWCGYGDSWATEVYPPAGQVVNVANIRHIWLHANAPYYAWRPGIIQTGTRPIKDES